MTNRDFLRIFSRPAAAAAALLLMSGCSGSGSGSDAGNESRAPNAAAAVTTADPAAQGPVAAEEAATEAPALATAAREEDREQRGPSRQARCRVNDEPERSCTFTPVWGDGSFDIEMPDRKLRLIVDGEEAAPFELIGARRVPLVGLLKRDAKDRACWVSDDPDAVLRRVCAR
jgi:hypothetical protein